MKKIMGVLFIVMLMASCSPKPTSVEFVNDTERAEERKVAKVAATEDSVCYFVNVYGKFNENIIVVDQTGDVVYMARNVRQFESDVAFNFTMLIAIFAILIAVVFTIAIRN